MIYVGIDIAKLNHFASAISSDGEILIEPFKFLNDLDGFQLLISKLEPFSKDELIIGLESTAHYGDNLTRYLVAESFNVFVITLSKRLPCGATTSVKRILIRSTLLLSPKPSRCRILLGFSPSPT